MLLADLEADLVERVSATDKTDDFAQAVTAFCNDLAANSKPGYLIIGASDDGSLAGLEVTDRLLQSLAALRSDGNILPLPAINVGEFRLSGGEVAFVEVLPSEMPPVRYKGQAWVRIGPRRAIANEQEEKILTERRVSGSRTFDALPCPDSPLEDLHASVFRQFYLPKAVSPDVIAENHRTIDEQLASLRFFDRRRNCPTNAGVLLFGKNPRAFCPGSNVQYLRIKGTSLAGEVFAERAVSGDLLTVLRRVDDLIELVRQWPVPETALREAIRYDIPAYALREFQPISGINSSPASNKAGSYRCVARSRNGLSARSRVSSKIFANRKSPAATSSGGRM